ncbi:MAG: hypothetical protein JXA50_06590 [Deltaproteobacteria bacterium]|jgi:uncharacterized membrane protein YqaE (UPF0057 family)|nr:hypothetical protein [Deltaproteobacteria bacterium]
MALKLICPNCGYLVRPKKVVKGSILIEVFLWLLFIIPGLLYSLWRLSTKTSVCPACGTPNPVPIDSPRGRKLLDEFGYKK